MKKKIQKNKKAEKNYSENHVAVILEDMQSQFKAFGDGQSVLIDRVNKIDIRLSNVEDKVVDVRFNSVVAEGELKEIKRDIKDGFKDSMEYFSRIEEEMKEMKSEIADLKQSLKGKADLNRLEILERKFVVMEKEFKQKVALA